ncbi:cytochrome P450 [Cladorrhinum sp. PSN259]|nr:cytochrome P450 [Cladorrhinum sp. PSN259]
MALIKDLQAQDLSSWLLVLAAGAPIYFIAQVIYNIFFHPLAHIPGPFWARASSIPTWFQARTGKRHLWLWQQFQIYNTDKLRVEPNVVVFRDPEAYSAIYGMESNVQRSTFYKMWQRNSEDVNTMNALEPAEHARKRKILNRCFTDKSLRAAATFIIKHIDRWNEILIDEPKTAPGEWSRPVNLSHRLEALVLDILTDLCFGQSAQIKEPDSSCPNPSFKSIPDCISEYLQFYYPLCLSPFASLMIWLKPRGLDKLFQLITPPAIKQYNDFVHSAVTSRLSSTSSSEKVEPRQDMFHFLTANPSPESSTGASSGLLPLSKSELLAECHLLIIAGSDTTSTTLSGLFFHLTSPSCSHVLEKLTTEIRTTFSSLDQITYPSPLLMTQCKYLSQVVTETLRLITPVPCELPRQVLPGGITIQGEHYPEGTIVASSHFITTHSTDIWGEDASEFNPDRWATGDKHQLQRMRGAYHPFLSGPGNCAGKSLAMSEMYMTVARTLWLFDVRRLPGSNKGGGGSKSLYGPAKSKNHFNLFDAFVALKEGPEVQFRRRQV